eukprot:CAMPEP_0180509258 /NCGR_PEP_ID=MMETSP1036_2-20121128/49624_1 /TAXON_ID=632150 /ORGANISM="Azadinium spinosum, Strain 3D9" /LENGTH=44 /DNA_ID= /DNA_START= /DNA_END= /DNA_ORIENTATION=
MAAPGPEPGTPAPSCTGAIAAISKGAGDADTTAKHRPSKGKVPS